MDENDELGALVQRARAGDSAARDALLVLLRARARRYADHLLGGQFGARADASDMAQEAFLHIGDGFDPSEFPSVPHLLAWLNTVVRNAVTDLRRRHAARLRDGNRDVAGGDLFPGMASDTTGPSERVNRAEREARLEAAVRALPERERAVFLLRFREDLTFEEIARRVGGYRRERARPDVPGHRTTAGPTEGPNMTAPNSPPDEAPASPTEERLGQFVADALDRLRRGEPAVAEDLLADHPDLIERGRELVRDLAAFPAVPDRAPDLIDAPLPQPFPKDFLVTRLLGAGSYGRVWLAEDLHLPRQVALKTLRVPTDSDVGVEALAALRREAGFLVGISHPNVVRVYGWRQAGDEHYLILEYVPGGSLDALVRSAPLPWHRAGRHVADVAEGLLGAHGKGIIHRDIKPANILLDPEPDEAKLTDFGVAGRLADAGTVIGTATYMAPEAFRGRATEASDVYGLAVTLFRLVAGEVPFRGKTRDEQVRLIEGGLPDPDPRLDVVPESLEQVVRAGLAPTADRRPSLREFVDRLRGGFNQSLADDLTGAGSGDIGLHLGISRETGTGRWEVVAATRPPRVSLRRDMRRAPREPDSVRVRTGEWVRVEVTADRDGFVIVFNVGPTGNLNVLYPDRPAATGAPPDLRAGRPLLIADVVFDPPAGRERVFAVWSANPLALSLRDLLSLADGGTGSRPYRASRDMRRMKEEVTGAGAGNCRVAVLELTHDAVG